MKKTNKKSNPIYIAWRNIRSRCCNSNRPDFKRYGDRGITVCQRWINSFENFAEDMGERPKGTTIERINNNGNYEPENCRWATPKEQANNTRATVFLEYNGERKTLSQWAAHTGLRRTTIVARFKLNWDVKDILSPIKRTCKKQKNSRYLTYESKTLSLTQWAKLKNMKLNTLFQRCYRYNFDPIKCLANSTSQ